MNQTPGLLIKPIVEGSVIVLDVVHCSDDFFDEKLVFLCCRIASAVGRVMLPINLMYTKETYDYARYGQFDTKDLIATTLGGLIVNYIIKKTNERKNKKRNR